jgi:hypothetical protein
MLSPFSWPGDGSQRSSAGTDLWRRAGLRVARGYQYSVGVAVEPLYARAPAAARQDAQLYGLLALTDALRLGRPRGVKLTRHLLERQAVASALIPAIHA